MPPQDRISIERKNRYTGEVEVVDFPANISKKEVERTFSRLEEQARPKMALDRIIGGIGTVIERAPSEAYAAIRNVPLADVAMAVGRSAGQQIKEPERGLREAGEDFRDYLRQAQAERQKVSEENVLGALGGQIAGGVAIGARLLQGVKPLQITTKGQPVQNTLKLMATGGLAAGAESGLRTLKPEKALADTVVGAVAAPVGVGLVKGTAAIPQLPSAFSALAKRLAEGTKLSPQEIADYLRTQADAVFRRTGRGASVSELINEETADVFGQLAQRRATAARGFKEAEQTALERRAATLPGEIERQLPPQARNQMFPEQGQAAITARGEAATEGLTSAFQTRAGQIVELPPGVPRSPEAFEELASERIRATLQPLRDAGAGVIFEPDDAAALLASPAVRAALGPKPTLAPNSAENVRRSELLEAITRAATGEDAVPIRLSIQDVDDIRRFLRNRENAAQIGSDFLAARNLANEITDFASEQVPEYRTALQEYGQIMAMAEGFPVGAKALTPEATRLSSRIETMSPAQRAGVEAGAKVTIADQTLRSAAGFADKVLKNPEGVRAALEADGGTGADELIALARAYTDALKRADTLAKQGIDATQAAARVLSGDARLKALYDTLQTDDVAREYAQRILGTQLQNVARTTEGAYRTARTLAEEPSVIEDIGAVMGPGAARNLQELGQMEIRAARSQATMAQTAERDPTLRQALKAVGESAIIAKGRFSGGFLQNWGERVLGTMRRLGLSNNEMVKMVKLMTERDALPSVIAYLERRGYQREFIDNASNQLAPFIGVLGRATIGEYPETPEAEGTPTGAADITVQQLRGRTP